MNYRIKTNGKSFIVQKKGVIFWRDEKEYRTTPSIHCPVISFARHFKSEKDAEKYMKEEYGNNTKRFHCWRHI